MPELVNIQDWSASSGITDPLKSKTAYADYIREAYLEEGTYNPEIENSIRESLSQSIRQDRDQYSDEDIKNALTPQEPTFDDKFKYVTRDGVIDSRSEEADTLREYNAFLNIKNRGDATPEFLEKEEELFGRVSKVVDDNYSKGLDQALEDGLTPFAIYKTEGGIQIKGGDAAAGLSAFQAYQRGKEAGFLNASHIGLVQQAMKTKGDTDVPLWRYKNYTQALDAINVAKKEDGFTRAINRYAQELGKKRASGERLQTLKNEAVTELARNLPDTLSLPYDDRAAAIEYVAGSQAMSSGAFDFDDDDLTNNIRTFGYGDYAVHDNLFADRAVFNEAVKGMPTQQKERLENHRKARLQALLPVYKKALNDTYLSSSWNDALTQGLIEGKEETEIFEDYMSETEYSGFRNEFVGSVLRSIPDAFTDTGAGLTVAVSGIDGEPNETALNILLTNQRQRQARQQVAQMFGNDVGFVTTLTSMVAPVAVDLTATALLTATTGVGGAAYMGLKTGTRLTTKGIVKGIVAGALSRSAGRETAEQTADRLLTQKLIKDFGNPTKNYKQALKDIDDDVAKNIISKEQGALMKSSLEKAASPTKLGFNLAQDAIDENIKAALRPISAQRVLNQYNKVVSNKFALNTSIFLPAATRSGSMTYAAVYADLPEDMDPVERHQKSLGAGMFAGALTGSIVLGFRGIGLGGVEDFIGTRASSGAVRKFIKGLSKTADKLDLENSDRVLDRTIAQIVKGGVKKQWSRVNQANEGIRSTARGFIGEGLEEGLDEFLNSFIQTGDAPFMNFEGREMALGERVVNAGMAAIYGGIFGAAMPLARPLGRMVRGSTIEEAGLAKRRVAEEVSNRLKKSSSPLSAAAIEERFDALDRESFARKQEQEKEASRPEPPIVREDPTIDLDDTPPIEVSGAAQAIPTDQELPLEGEPARREPQPESETVQFVDRDGNQRTVVRRGVDERGAPVFEEVPPVTEESGSQQLTLPLDEQREQTTFFDDLGLGVEASPRDAQRVPTEGGPVAVPTQREGDEALEDTPLGDAARRAQRQQRRDEVELVGKIIEEIEQSTAEEQAEAYAQATAEEETQGSPLNLRGDGLFVSLPTRAALDNIAEESPELAMRLERSLLMGTVVEEELFLFIDQANEAGMDTVEATKALLNYLRKKQSMMADPEQVVKFYEEHPEASPETTQAQREEAQAAAALMEAEPTKEVDDFALEVLGLSKRDLNKLRKESREAEKAAYLTALSNKIEGLINQHIAAGVPVKVTKETPYGFPLDAFRSHTLSAVAGDVRVGRQKTFKEVNEYINGTIRKKHPVLTTDMDAAERKPFIQGVDQSRFTETKIPNTKGIPYQYDPEGEAQFNNDPLSMAAAARDHIVVVPDGFTGLNPAIKTDQLGNKTVIVAVHAPHPTNPDRVIDLVTEVDVSQTLTKFIEKPLKLSNGIDVPPTFQFLNLSARFESDGETFPIFEPSIENGEAAPITMEEAMARMDSLYKYAQGMFVEETRSAETADRASLEEAAEFANILTRIANSTFGGTLSGNKTIDEAVRAGFMADLLVSIHTALKIDAVRQELSDGALSRDEEGNYVISDSAVERLFQYIQIPEVVPTLAIDGGKPLPSSTDNQKKALFLLENGYLGGRGKETPTKLIRKSPRAKTPKEGWENIVLKHFFESRLNEKTQRPAANGNFPDMVTIVQSLADRNKKRAKTAREIKTSNEASEVSVGTAQQALEVGGEAQVGSDPTVESTDGSRPSVLKELAELQELAKPFVKQQRDEDPATELPRKTRETLRQIARALDPQTERLPFDQHVVMLLGALRKGKATTEVVNIMFEALENGDIPQELYDLAAAIASDPKLFGRRDLPNTQDAPSVISDREVDHYRQVNESEVERLGLQTGDPESVIQALTVIAETSLDPDNRLVAQLLLKNPDLIRSTNFVIYNVVDGRAGFYHTQAGRTGQDIISTVAVNLAGYYGTGVESVLLHEYLHAFTSKFINGPTKGLPKSQRKALARLRSLFDELQQFKDAGVGGPAGIEFRDALSSMNEFVAAFFSSDSFQKNLKGLAADRSDMSYFRKIMDAILDLVGLSRSSRLNRKFRKAFDNLTNLLVAGKPSSYTTSPKYSTSPAAALEARYNAIAVATGRDFTPFYGVVPKVTETGDFAALPTEVQQAVTPFTTRSVANPDLQFIPGTVETLPQALKGTALYSSFEAVNPDQDVELSAKQLAIINQAIDKRVSQIPNTISVAVVDSAAEAPRAFEGRPNAAAVATLLNVDGDTVPVIFISRENMVKALAEKEIPNALNLEATVDAVLSEEVFHIAEFKAIPQAEIDALAGSMRNYEFDEIIDEYTSDPSLNGRLKQAIADGDAETKNQMIGEMLRMKLQRVLRGTTTEEDVAFYETNPNAFRVMLRYFANIFRRLYARYNLSKDNPVIANMIQEMSYDLGHLANGGAAFAPTLPFDPRDPDAGYRVLARRFEATASEIKEDTEISEVLARFRGMFDTLKLPFATFSKGKYAGHEGTDALLYGEVDPRVVELKKRESAFLAAMEKVSDDKLSRFEAVRKRNPLVTDTLIGTASGSTADAVVDTDFKISRIEEYRAWRENQEQLVEAGEASPNTLSKANRTLRFKQMVKDRVKEERLRLQQEIRDQISSAFEQIQDIDPELAAVIKEIRVFNDTLSTIMKSEYGLSGKVEAKIDSQSGIYLTRAYRAFSEEGYIDKILKEQTSEVFQEARDYFEQKWVSTQSRFLRKQARKAGSPITKEFADQQARNELQSERESNQDPVREAMVAYLQALDARANNKELLRPPKGLTRTLVANLESRRKVPPVIQKLLGVYGPEEGIENSFRTMSVLTRMIARQNFNNNLIAIGSDPENDFVLTHAEIKRRVAAGETKLSDYVNLRTGNKWDSRDEPLPKVGVESDYDKTFGYYTPPELNEGMRKMFSPEARKGDLTSLENALQGGITMARYLTGLSLSAKTMGSVGFYLRNVIGNLVFFGPSQGLGPVSLLRIMFSNGGMKHIFKGVFGNTRAFDEYYAELRSLNVIGGDLYASQIRDLFKGGGGLKDAQKEINTLLDKIKVSTKAGAKKVDQALLKRLENLSQGVDAFYKIGYYEAERANLTKARQSDIDTGIDTGYLNLSDSDLKEMAAKKVRRTAQSYSDSIYLVEKLNKKFGPVLTPFFRFKTEVIRVTINTFKLAIEEIKSPNPVIKARGVKRLIGINTVLFGFSMVIPTAVRLGFGIEQDEDEFLRAAGPEYKKFATFFYYSSGGKLKQVDATFLNPYAIETDGTLRLVENVLRGKPDKGIQAFLGSLGETFLDEQIFLGGLIDAGRNVRSDNNQPIVEESDDIVTKATKYTSYVFSEAFAPRTPAAAVRAALDIGAEPPADPERSSVRKLLNEFHPARPYTVDPERSFQRYLEKKRDERNRATARFNVLKSRGSLTERRMRRETRKWIDTRKRIDEEIYRTVYASLDLGLSPKKAANVMSITSLGMGKNRQKNIVLGQMDRPVLTEPFKNSLIGLTSDGAVGRQRIRIIEDEIKKYGPRMLTLETE